MRSTTPELSDVGAMSDDVTVTSLQQQQQEIAVDVGSGNNVDEVMAGISNSQNDIRGTLVYYQLEWMNEWIRTTMFFLSCD